MANPVVEFQIFSSTPEETARFYTVLFGWRVNEDNAMKYRRIGTGTAEGAQGGIFPSPGGANFLQLVIAVDDVAASVKAAKGLGATPLIPPVNLPEGGKMAVMRDPQGLQFAMLQRDVIR